MKELRTGAHLQIRNPYTVLFGGESIINLRAKLWFPRKQGLLNQWMFSNLRLKNEHQIINPAEYLKTDQSSWF